jgi:hypothetical protein
MKPSKTVIWLSALIVVLAVVAAGVGLFWQDGGSPFSFTTLLVVSSVLGAGVLALSTAQLLAGVLTPAETIVFVVPFVILTAVGIWLTVVLFRNLSEPAPLQVATLRSAQP